jgi:Ca-activated chloride channel family protein
MKLKIIFLSLLAVLLIFLFVFSHKNIKGNNKAVKEFDKGNYEEAAEILDAQAALNKSAPVIVNSAGADYKKGDLEKSAAKYDAVLNSTMSAKNDKFNALYGLGNIEYQNNSFQKAADYYKEALKINPQDADAKYNLELALKKLEEQKQQQDEQQKKDDKDANQQKKENDKQQQENKEKQDEAKQKEQEAQKKEEQSKQEKRQAQQKQQESQDPQEQDKLKEEEQNASVQEEAAKKEREKQSKISEQLAKEKQELDKQKKEIDAKMKQEQAKPDNKNQEKQQNEAQQAGNKDASPQKNNSAAFLLNYYDEADKNADKLRNKKQAPMVNQPAQDW